VSAEAAQVIVAANKIDALDAELPASIAFHVLDGGRLTSHFRVVQ
jgi:hypothetical protein